MSSPPNLIRTAARLSGAKYFDGDVCDICGSALRYVSNGACRACTIEKGKSRYARFTPEQLATQKRRDKDRYAHRLDSGIESA